MQINRKSFLDLLGKLIPTIGMGADNPDNYFNFNNKDGVTYISTSNGNSMSVVESPYHFDECRVCGMELFNLLRTLPDDELEIFLINGSFRVRSKTGNTEVCLDSAVKSFSDILELSKDAWKKLPESFSDGLSMCVKSCSDDGSMSPFLTYVYIEGTKMIGSNGAVITTVELPSSVDKMFISAKLAKTVITASPDMYQQCPGWVCFKNNEVLVAIRTLYSNEKYPLIVNTETYTPEELTRRKRFILDNLLMVSGEHINVSNIEDIKTALKSCSLFAKKEKSLAFVTVSINNGIMEMDAVGTRGQHHTALPFNADIDVKFSVSISLFNELLDFSESFILAPDRILSTHENVTKLIALCKVKESK